MSVMLYPRTIVLLLVALTGLNPLFSQVRAIDGVGNNESNPELGATQTPLKIITSLNFADQYSAPNGADRPNPREISNQLFAQSEAIYDDHDLTDYVWVFGQFLDHDIILVNSGQEPAMIVVPPCDPIFDPNCESATLIPMTRSEHMEGTGTELGNPRKFANNVTSFIDGSAVYGSDAERANWLRTFEDGKLKTSKGNLLPFNTVNGEINGATDIHAPEMEQSTFTELSKWFVAGDVRANENVLLTAMHTLFVREHNRLCDELAIEYPNASDEQLYQKARSMVAGMIQAITYNEWLPTMGVDLESYRGYNPSIDPSISNVFSAAAFRFGHTLLSSDILRMQDDCNTMAEGDMTLREAFFNPIAVVSSGIDPFVKGMSAQIQQSLDCKVIDDVRNFLFGPPGSGFGMDLAAININRGRERGLPDYNSIRSSLGLPSIKSFDESFDSHTDARALEALYGDVNEIDPWVGLLAEIHMPGAIFGETMMSIIKSQFRELRDGDRFYFMSDPSLSADEIEMINNSRLSDIVRRNTDLQAMQTNVFEMTRTCYNVDIAARELELLAYPNPIRDHLDLTVYSFAGGPATVRIFDALGRVIYHEEVVLEKGSTTMGMQFDNQLNRGLYHLDVSRAEDRNSVKIYVSDQ